MKRRKIESRLNFPLASGGKLAYLLATNTHGEVMMAIGRTIAMWMVFATVLRAPAAFAKIEALFHPHDPTLEKIASWIQDAKAQIDIAMYNMDTTAASPVIRVLQSEPVKGRLAAGDLKIRLIFEGYGDPKDNDAKMQALEDLGLDVRFLGKSVKIHHKFAAIDTGLPSERVISGSANWSMGSYRFYNENILFFESEPEANREFQAEFERLWLRCKEFGQARGATSPVVQPVDDVDLSVHFNSPRRLRLDPDDRLLTDEVVRLIDGAQKSLAIASTRVRLQPTLEALARAADRGVSIRIVLSQDDFHDLYKRSQWLERPGVQTRLKFYSLKPSSFLTHQMHNKFMVVDESVVLTGSFNWSVSGETSHIENLVEVTGRSGHELAQTFLIEFESIWEMGRAGLEDFKAKLAAAKRAGEKPRCSFSPIVMEPKEIRSLLGSNRNCTR